VDRPEFLVIVRRGEERLFELLAPAAGPGTTVIWDRRLGERRVHRDAAWPERRRGDRRGEPAWNAQGYLAHRTPVP
jgi:hypothetical protein